MSLGFFGSFGHCVGMCGPSQWRFRCPINKTPSWQQQLYFHTLLNLGRIVSYALVGALIGALGSVLMLGEIAGIGSDLRRWLAILGIMLIWFWVKPNQTRFPPPPPSYTR